MFSQLEDLDYADDIALLSTNARHLQQKANVLNENAKKAGLHINLKKTKVMHLNLTEPHPQIMIDGEELEAVDDFTYLGSNISAENSVQKDIIIIIIIIFIRINNYTYRVHIKHLSTNYIKIFRIENKLYYNNYFYKIIVIQYNI